MKKVILSLLVIHCAQVYSQDSCAVKIFPNDCLNCYLGMKSVEEIGNGVKKTIVFPDLNEAEVNTYINKILNIKEVNKYNIIVSDSIFNAMNQTLTSEVYVYNDQELYEYSPLKKFYGLVELDRQELKIPDSIAFSQAITLINTEKYFFITDSKFAKYVFVEKEGNNEISVVKASDLTTKDNFYKISGDSACYHLFLEYRDILRGANMDVMRLNHTFSRNYMTSHIMAPNIIITDSVAGLSFISGIIEFNSPNNYSILRIDEESLPEGYFVFPGFYYSYSDEIFLQIMPIDKTIDDQYLLGKFSLEKDKLVFEEFTNYKLPDEYLPAKKYKSLRKILSPSEPFVFLQYSLSYFNMDDGNTYKLPLDPVSLDFEMPGQSLNLMKFEYNFKYVDAIVTDTTIKLIYEQSGKYYLAVIDRSKNSLVQENEIENIPQTVKAGLSFYTEDMVLYFTNDNKIVVDRINLK